MSNQYQQQPFSGNVPPPPPIPHHAPPRKKGHKVLWIVLGIVVVILALCALGTWFLASAARNATVPGSQAVRSGTSADLPGVITDSPSPGRSPHLDAPTHYGTPKPADFKLRVKILTKQCFGSAGCSVEFRVSGADYSGPTLDPNKNWEVTYSIRGLESAFVSTFVMDGSGQFETPEREFGMTANSSIKLIAIVSKVEEF